MDKWQTFSLSEFIEINPKENLRNDKEYFYVEMKDMKPDSKYALPSRRRILKGGSRFKDGDTLFARISPCLEKGNINQVKGLNNEQAWGSTEFLIFRAIEGISDKDFVTYLAKSNIVKDYGANNLQGSSGRQRVAKEAFDDLEINLPPLHEQTAIASVLSSLDDKIDLLHRQNTTLEKMAETLFRQWFVEEAKEEWEEMPLSSIATFLNGLACQKFPPKNNINRLPVLKIKELTAGITDNSDWATTDVRPEYIIKNGDVIFAWSASLMVKIWSGDECILNQHLFKVTSNQFPKWFYFFWCNQHLREFISIAQSHATTMGHIKRSDLDEAMVIIPSTQELEEMSNQMNPLLDKIQLNSNQINSLSKLRDTLLPKLMSGEIRLNTI